MAAEGTSGVGEMDAPPAGTIRAPPGLSLNPGGRSNRLSLLIEDPPTALPGHGAVQVKNTFIHVGEASQVLPRSRSDSDLSSGCDKKSNGSGSSEKKWPSIRSVSGSFERKAPPSVLNQEGVETGLHGALTSSNDDLDHRMRQHLQDAILGPTVPQSSVATASVRNTVMYVEGVTPPWPNFASVRRSSLPMRVSPGGVDLTPGAASSSFDNFSSIASSSAPLFVPMPGATGSRAKLDVANAAPPVDNGPFRTEAGFDEVANDDLHGHGAQPDWSVGSAHHDAGLCTPCWYYRSQQGCINGRKCKWCHLPHEHPRARPCKKQRARCKEVVKKLEQLGPGTERGRFADLDVKLAQMCSNATDRAYIKEILSANARREQESVERQEASAGSSAQHDMRHQPDRHGKMSL